MQTRAFKRILTNSAIFVIVFGMLFSQAFGGEPDRMGANPPGRDGQTKYILDMDLERHRTTYGDKLGSLLFQRGLTNLWGKIGWVARFQRYNHLSLDDGHHMPIGLLLWLPRSVHEKVSTSHVLAADAFPNNITHRPVKRWRSELYLQNSRIDIVDSASRATATLLSEINFGGQIDRVIPISDSTNAFYGFGLSVEQYAQFSQIITLTNTQIFLLNASGGLERRFGEKWTLLGRLSVGQGSYVRAMSTTLDELKSLWFLLGNVGAKRLMYESPWLRINAGASALMTAPYETLGHPGGLGYGAKGRVELQRARATENAFVGLEFGAFVSDTSFSIETRQDATLIFGFDF